MTETQSKLDALLDGTLDPGDFSHADHIATAYGALGRYDFFTAQQKIAAAIKALTHRAGVPEKFHATLTMAHMCLIHERMLTRPHSDADDFIRNNPDLLEKNTVQHLYRPARLNSPLARQTPLLPDRAP